jgi:hypothetical protein
MNLIAEAGDVIGIANDDTVTAELSVVMRNNGNHRVNEPITVTFYRDEALTQVLGSETVPAPGGEFLGMTGCAVRGLEVTIDADWGEVTGTGPYPYWVKVDSDNAIPEEDEEDNVANGWVSVVSNKSYVPFLSR